MVFCTGTVALVLFGEVMLLRGIVALVALEVLLLAGAVPFVVLLAGIVPLVAGEEGVVALVRLAAGEVLLAGAAGERRVELVAVYCVFLSVRMSILESSEER